MPRPRKAAARYMPFNMTSTFIEKYALTVEPYEKIKTDLNLTTQEFYALTKSLSAEIEIARKVRRLFLRKKFATLPIQTFNQWLTKQNRSCFYCDITEQELSALFEILKEVNKRPTRGKTLELERKIADRPYDELDNLVLCCYMCNNAKSDFFSHEQFIPIGKAIKQVWKNILNPI